MQQYLQSSIQLLQMMSPEKMVDQKTIKQCQGQLKASIREAMPTFDDDCFQRCLEERTQSFSAFLVRMLEDSQGKFLKRQGLLKMRDSLSSKMLKDEGLSFWIGDSFKSAWMALEVAKEKSLGPDYVNKFLKNIVTKELGCEDVEQFIRKMVDGCNHEELQDEDELKEMINRIGSNSSWVNIKNCLSNAAIFGESHSSAPSESDIQEAQNRGNAEYLESLKKCLNTMGGSILDELIQKNLTQAYEYEVMHGEQAYVEKDYHEFTKKLGEVAKNFDVFSSELRLELDDIPEKGKLYNKILKIRSIIHPVFVPELASMLGKNKAARGAIAGRDTIVLLGSSGAGKTTTVQVLLGYKLKRGKDKEGVETLQPTTKLNDRHRQFIAKASSKSVTKYVSAISVNLQDYNYYEPIYIVDTPGFFDTGGLVVDACNSLSTIEVLGTSNSIRFAFIFNYKAWGKRADAFRQFVKVVSKVFASYEQNKSKVVYILNEFTQAELEGFPARIREFRRNGLNELDKSNKKLLSVVDHFMTLLQQAENTSKKLKNSLSEVIKLDFMPQLILIDPLNPDLEEIYGKLLNQDRKLINTKKELESIVSEDVRKALSSEATQLEFIINSCIKNKSINAVKYYLSSLQEISSITKDVNDCAQAKEKHKRIVEKLKNQLSSQAQIFKQNMRKVMSLRNEEDNFREFKRQKDQLQEFEQDYKGFPGLQNIDYTSQILEQVEEISEKLVNKLESQENISDDLHKTVLLFSKYFNEKLVEVFIRQRNNKENVLINKIKSLLEKKEFGKFDEFYPRLVEICKLAGDMEERLEPQRLKKEAENRIQEVFQEFKRIINLKASSQTLYLQSDIQLINKHFQIFSANSILLPKLQEGFDKSKKEIIELFRGLMTKINKFMKCNSDEIVSSQEDRRVFNCKMNALALRKVTQIESDTKYELQKMLLELNKEITAGKEALDLKLDEVGSNGLGDLKIIHRAIRRLQKLNSLCEPKQRNQNLDVINLREGQLKKKLQLFYDEIQLTSYTLQTYKGSTQKILIAYRICYSITKDHDGNRQSRNREMVDESVRNPKEEQDEIVESCKQIVEKIKDKIRNVIEEIKSFIQNMNNLNNKENVEKIHEGIVGQYIRCNMFFQQIKCTDFSPKELNLSIQKVRSDFRSTLNSNFNFFGEMTIQGLNQIVRGLKNNDLASVNRRNIENILRLKNITDNIQKMSGLKQLLDGFITQLGNEAFAEIGQPYKIRQAISSIMERLRTNFNASYQNLAYDKCCNIISASRALECLDVVHTLKPNIQELTQVLDKKINQDLQGLQKNYQNLLDMSNMENNLLSFKKVFGYFEKFGEGTEQHSKLNQMIKHLKLLIARKQATLVAEMKKVYKSSNWDPNLDDKSLMELYNSIEAIFGSIRDANSIMNVPSNYLGVSAEILNKIGETCFKILKNFINKIDHLINMKGYKQAEIFLKKIDTLETIFEDFQIKKEDYRSKLQQLNESSVALHYKNKLENLENTMNKKYKGDKVTIEANFVEQISSYDKVTQEKIKGNVIKQMKQQIFELEKQYSNEATILIEKIENIEKDATFLYLTKEIQDELNKEINAKLAKLRQEKERVETEARNSFKFQQSYDLMNKESKKNVLQIYEDKTKKELEAKLNELKASNKNAKEIIEIFKITFVQLIEDKKLDENLRFKTIYEEFRDNAVKIIESHIERRLSNLSRILTYQKAMRSKQFENISKFSENFEETYEILKFILSYRKMVNNFNFLKYLEDLKNILGSLIKELSQKHNLTLEQMKDDPFAFYAWNYECCIFKAGLNVLQSEQVAQFYKIYESYLKNLEEIQNKQLQIRDKVDSIDKDLQAIKIYSENGKNMSDHDRRDHLKQIQQKANTLMDLEKLGDQGRAFFGKSFKEIIQRVKTNIKAQIEDGINKSVQDVKTGFSDLNSEFSKEINISLGLARYANEILTFFNIEKGLKTKIESTIEAQYKALENSFQKQIEQMVAIKSNQDAQIRECFKYSNAQKQKLKAQSQEREKEMMLQFKNVLEDKLRNQKDAAKIKSAQDSYSNEVSQRRRQIMEEYQNFCKEIDMKTEKKQADMSKELMKSLANYCDLMALFYKAVLEISFKQDFYKQKIEKSLAEHKRLLGKKKFHLVFETFKNRNNTYASMLIGSLEVFRVNQAIQWEAKVKGNGIEYVLQELKVKDIKKHALREMYEKYQLQFKSWTKKYQTEPNEITINQLLQSIRNSAETSSRFYDGALKAQDFNPQILLAQIMVLWTILQSEIDEDTVEFPYQPHPAQIVTIFLCLSSLPEDFPRDLSSKIAQVGTGEGKSLILAGIASFLALSGFEVNCVCYSEYLSSRDHSAFSKLFFKLQIADKIKYGTFNSVCESLLNKDANEEGDFTSQIKKILEGPSENAGEGFLAFFKQLFKKLLPSLSHNSPDTKKVMLIDEVDVFFNKSFFGEVYRPEVCISSPQIKELMKTVWKMFKDNPEITDIKIKETREYVNATKRFKKIVNILNEQVKGMILGCRNCNHDYIIRDDQIQYKDQDGFSSKLNYGFSTLFAYLKEHDYNRIASIEKAFRISCIVAEFSYAMLPKYFRSIIGVTGTYDEMPQYQKNYMRDEYEVKDTYAIPSVYGIARRRLINKEIIVAPENHHKEIIREIEEVHKTGRPVLVFFDCASDLESLYNCKDYLKYQNITTFLNETHQAGERDLRIKKTCQKGQITFMTRAFGRGTDFIVFDESIFKLGTHGGLHVIQTFLSIQNSEEVQIQGRTARQGDPGTYILIIKSTDLEKLQIKELVSKSFETEIKRARKRQEQKEHGELAQMLKQSKAKHENCTKVYMNEQIKESDVINYIFSLNKYGQVGRKSCKTCILVDGTVSMRPAIKKLHAILEDVMKDVGATISKYPNAKESQIQLGVYRNYNCKYSTIFQTTSFESRPQNLLNFWKDVKATGGMGNEALQIAYNYLNQSKQIDQAIIIGDARANTEEETKEKRESADIDGLVGEEYWSKYFPVMSAQQELRNIKIPVHCFYIKADEYFKGVSQATGGRAQKFHINDPDASRSLSYFIAQRILSKAAQNDGQANRMIQDFGHAFIKRYS